MRCILLSALLLLPCCTRIERQEPLRELETILDEESLDDTLEPTNVYVSTTLNHK